MKYLVFIFTLLFVNVSFADTWDQTVRINATEAASPIHVNTLTQDTFFIIDTSSTGFGGFYLPDPSTFCFTPRRFGAYKADNSSNTIQFFAITSDPNNPVHVSGFNYVTLNLLGDSIVIGCDATGYWIESRSESVKQYWAQHRTVLVSAGQSPYMVNDSRDRHAIIRVVADSGQGQVNLPALSTFVVPNGYRNTFTLSVERTANSVYDVIVCPPTGKTIDNSASCVHLTEARQIISFDYDSAEWITTNNHP